MLEALIRFVVPSNNSIRPPAESISLPSTNLPQSLRMESIFRIPVVFQRHGHSLKASEDMVPRPSEPDQQRVHYVLSRFIPLLMANGFLF
jgi:hypothetical protein